MRLKIINFLILMFILIQLVLPVALLAVEIAPRISDREIIEKLAILEVGQGALHVVGVRLRLLWLLGGVKYTGFFWSEACCVIIESPLGVFPVAN